MTSSRPYLLRAIHEWLVDNDLTPYVLVNAELAGVAVPTEYVKDGRIVLNLSPRATQGLLLANDRVEFSARFGGVSRSVSFPPSAAVAIYARENGKGMVFTDDDGDDEPPSGGKPGGDKPKLTLVK